MAPGRPSQGPPPGSAPPPGRGAGGASPPGYPGAPPAGGYPGYPHQAPPGHGYAMGVKPHRGVVILVRGICGFAVCVVCGIIAWIMANNDLREMQAGTMDSEGYQLTNAGRICGMISTILTIIGLAFFMIFMIFVAAGSTF